jgi:hypothetical protein
MCLSHDDEQDHRCSICAEQDLIPAARFFPSVTGRTLSQRLLLDDYDAIVAATCIAWNKLTAEAGRLTSLAWSPWSQHKAVSQK